MLMHLPLLSLLIGLPIISGLLILLVGTDQDVDRVRFIALLTALVCFALSIDCYVHFDPSTYAMQFRQTLPWIAPFNINYDVGVDGISLPLVMLTTFVTVVVILAAWRSVRERVAEYLAIFLLIEGLMIGVFVSLDAILFYVFWEALLLPMYLAIGIWGSANRGYAAIKFFLYTFAGSVMMLVALLYLARVSGSFSILDFHAVPLGLKAQYWIFLAFVLGFAVKVPMWPVHTWLPDAHTEAPAGGSIILAALMLKMGVYGLLRFALPIVPDASQHFSNWMIALSLVAVVYIGFVALVQQDMKRLIAYSSVAHMGFATLGCFIIYAVAEHAGNYQNAYLGLEGAMVMMVAHGFSSGALFLGVGILYDRLHTRMIKDFGGVANRMPVFAALFMLFAMANVGLPGTAGFVGEFMVILSAFQVNFWVSCLAAMTLILAAAYTLTMYRRVFYGEVSSPGVGLLKDVRSFEWWALVLFALAVLFFGLYPAPLLDVYHSSVGHLLQESLRSKL